MKVLPILLFISEAFLRYVVAQEGKRDDTHVENVVRQAVADEFSSEILTNRTRAYLSCASGEMVIKLNFSEPFRGVTYTDYDRSSPCKFYGDGSRYYELRIPLKGCGTKQEAPRVFINNIIVRFHRSLELEEDEIKTIICRYPPPLAPTQVPIVLPPPTAAVPVIVPPKLSEVELLLIICALLFLTLLLLGIGIAYYCLKKRNIKVIKKKKAISSSPGSEITKLSGSTMGTLSMFDPIRIPRAIAQSTSGSEAALLTSLSSQNGSGDHSDTIPSDYPSESPSSVNSDVEEIEGGRRMMINDLSTMRSDHFKYENTAFIPDETSSIVSGYPEDQEKAASVSSIPVTQIMKPPEPPKKKLKTKVAREQVLTTISEREDAMLQREAMQRSYAAVSSIPHQLNPPVNYTQTYIREAPPKPPSSYAPSLYGSIPDNDNRSQAEFLEDIPVAMHKPPSSYAPSLKGSIPDNDIWSHSELESEVAVMPYVRKPKRETATVTDYYLSSQKTTDIEDDIRHLKKTTTLQHKPKTPPLSPVYDSEPEVSETYVSKALVPRKPKIIVQNIDDVFLTTTTEVHATETVTKKTKDTILQHVKSPPQSTEPPSSTGTPPSNWDVTIRHYPNQPPTDTFETDDKYLERRWDAYSEVSEKFRDAESTTTEIPAQRRPRHPSEHSTASTPKYSGSPYNTVHRVTKTIPHPTYTSIIYKVLEPPPVEGVEQLTQEIKEKWRTVITTDETFRYLVQEATTVEEYIRITKDSRYEKMFDTRTWNVIIRALSTPDDRYPPAQMEPPPDVRNPRYKKKNDVEPPRNRRSSLPPVTEFSLSRDAPPSISGSVRSRRTSRSGSMPDYDLRSMTEVDVDFAHADRESLWSVDTGYTYKTARSLAERSTSEFLEDVPTIVAERPTQYRGVHQQSHYYVEQSAAEFVRSQDSYHRDSTSREFGEGDYLQRDPLQPITSPQKPSRPRFLERSSTEYFEDVPTLSLPDLRQSSTEVSSITERRMDNVVHELRQKGRFSRSEVIIDSPIVRAIDRTSSIGEREEIKSVTETDVADWKR
ncbi:uncharacterized protein LOC129981530 [Argiope bruennichi]|uniref:uncharacterized protein LOC129981530 n=1 Tax=Argiope bruennichi TaxID=94029 RepID=UPI002494756B|nr:uncharacterized protein LOC129981530 [Argiope bruennichi]XP_055948367.1 uncharacterized protein LOC129981530 [Argiope bruennichi]XP_055948368.1 uncharacterized protein LOC129981530 [Argiope bruennichi]XP_055948369.1 uncharacterized protein LOC129981530 [Argiope bruennichi]XP_055948371.1 uncharacterized protein LOC129981530 [Argiope bruennichi]XP_055948372.1 uncharacterized protein LOC129981530 [Argiope bruennichi]XP_055948373.1 uncharacterized protein LOC129981530 [Argiope bruennichi]